jgi:hypothetical protein
MAFESKSALSQKFNLRGPRIEYAGDGGPH